MDDIDGTALEGAVFKIVDMNGNDVRTGITTDAKGKVSILIYILRLSIY